MLSCNLKAVLIACFFVTAIYAQSENGNGRKRQSADGQKFGQNQSGERSMRRRGQKGNQRMFDADAIFKRMDKNGDQQLEVSELPQRMRAMLSKSDVDGNGTISIAELKSAMDSRRRSGAGGAGPKSADGKARNRIDGKRDLMSNPDKMFSFLDKNGDGSLGKDEVPERMRKNFAKMDSNGNDQLEKNEVVAVVERMKAEGGRKGNRYDTDSSKTSPVMPKRPPRK